MAAHAPGPWHVNDNATRVWCLAGPGSARTVCEHPCDWPTARLIAAAPDLLSACAEVADWIDRLLGDALAQGIEYSADELALALATVKDRLRAAAAGATGTRVLP